MNLRIIPATITFAALALMPSCSEAQKKTKDAGPALTAGILNKLGFKKVSPVKAGDAEWVIGNIHIYSSYPYGKGIHGFSGPTPLFIAVDQRQKIIGMAAAPTHESPDVFQWTKPLMKAWNGKTLKEAQSYTPDAISGATFSSKAIIQTVHATAKAIAK